MNPADKNLPEIPGDLWEKFAPRLRSEIASRYSQISLGADTNNENDVMWMKAFLLYIDETQNNNTEKESWFSKNITGLMAVSAAMAITFGVLGIIGLSNDRLPANLASGFIDIAKLFSGAIVGAAGAVGATTIGRR